MEVSPSLSNLILYIGSAVAAVVILAVIGLAWRHTKKAHEIPPPPPGTSSNTAYLDDNTLDKFFDTHQQLGRTKEKVEALERERAEWHEERAALRGAVAELTEAAREPNPPAGIDEALRGLRQGDAAGAEEVSAMLAKRREEEPDVAGIAEAYRNLGAFARLNDTARAITAYEKASRTDPDHVWTWIFLGRLYQQAVELERFPIMLVHSRLR